MDESFDSISFNNFPALVAQRKQSSPTSIRSVLFASTLLASRDPTLQFVRNHRRVNRPGVKWSSWKLEKEKLKEVFFFKWKHRPLCVSRYISVCYNHQLVYPLPSIPRRKLIWKRAAKKIPGQSKFDRGKKNANREANFSIFHHE